MAHRILVVALALAAAACSSDAGETPTSSTVTTTVPTTGEATTTTAPTTTTELPGEVFDLGPREGMVLGVVAVRHDDVLNVRAAPGTDQDIVAELDPLEDQVVALGNARALPNSIWFEVEVEGTTGWASSAFLGSIGATDDITSVVVDELGEIPVAETMEDLGLIVAETQASAEPESRIRMSVAPSVGDLGEVTYDVIGIGDDAILGFRLHVFGAPTEGGEGFSLMSVESTLICHAHRGAAADGGCV